MERRHVDAKVEIMVTTTSVKKQDQNKGDGNQDCNREQVVQDSQCKHEEKEGKEEERQQEVKGDEGVGNDSDDEGDRDGDDEEDDQPPPVPLHPAVRRASWNPELAGNVAGRLLLGAGQPKTRRVSHHAMMTT